jgi:putative FmdB family regulatory protein
MMVEMLRCSWFARKLWLCLNHRAMIWERARVEGRDEVPVYEFICEDCGPFEQQRSFAEAGEPMACPSCGCEARRVYSPPNTRKMPAALSGAMDRAEKSAHEPEVVRRPAGGTGSGKGHHHSQGSPRRSATS